jgi:hypothetical protein
MSRAALVNTGCATEIRYPARSSQIDPTPLGP